MDELTQLAIKYGTDKWGKHHYTPVYYELFKNKQDKVKKVLEIGVAEGAGVRMFRDFFPNAQIYGVDNQDNRIIEENRIKVFKGDQSNQQDLFNILNLIGTDIDLIIDDGSHKVIDQIFTYNVLFPKVKKYVTYVIEDVNEKNILRSMNLVDVERLQMYKLGKRYDDCLIICQK